MRMGPLVFLCYRNHEAWKAEYHRLQSIVVRQSREIDDLRLKLERAKLDLGLAGRRWGEARRGINECIDSLDCLHKWSEPKDTV